MPGLVAPPPSPAENAETRNAKAGGKREPIAAGYQIRPAFEPAVGRRKRMTSSKNPGAPARAAAIGPAAPMADGLLPVLKLPETNWFASFLYPLRSIECMSVIAILSVVCWVFVILVPEYCLAIMGDADSMGAPTLGKFIALISILPALFLLPLGLLYWLQYLGRVLVSSAMGDTTPPRTPDRNFDGFLNGLSPWFVWLGLGASVGLLPFLIFCAFQTSAESWSRPVALMLFLLGFPYILMALLMSFLHDHALAAKPPNVIGALFRVGSSVLLLCAFALGTVGLSQAAFSLALLLRPGHFWIYLLACLVSWAAVAWCSIVLMRVLGNFYYPRRELLGWHHERPRWGVAWKL
ncbi:MAG: hypothetical protein ACLQIB_35780 [Isosphaeraceae bacterium]